MKTKKCPSCKGAGTVIAPAPSELRRAREAAGLSIRKMAELTGVSFQTLWRSESGERPATERTIAAYVKIEKPEEVHA